MKIRPVEAKLFHGDTRTNRQKVKLIVAFRNFANAPKNHIHTTKFGTGNFIVWQINMQRN